MYACIHVCKYACMHACMYASIWGKSQNNLRKKFEKIFKKLKKISKISRNFFKKESKDIEKKNWAGRVPLFADESCSSPQVLKKSRPKGCNFSSFVTYLTLHRPNLLYTRPPTLLSTMTNIMYPLAKQDE